jgi:hypothetical protein
MMKFAQIFTTLRVVQMALTKCIAFRMVKMKRCLSTLLQRVFWSLLEQLPNATCPLHKES